MKENKKRKYSPRKEPSIKKPGPQLERLITLAQLVPPGADLPPKLLLRVPLPLFHRRRENMPAEFESLWLPPGFKEPNTPEELTAAIAQLPQGTEALQNNLLVLMNTPEDWPLNYRQQAGRAANKAALEMARLACQADAVRNRYSLIRNANDALRSIASQNATGRFVSVFATTQLMIKVDQRTRKSVALYDPVYAALLGEDLTYVKACRRCERIFFAPRDNSVACVGCREAYRKRQQRNGEKDEHLPKK
jgi:hypothetical protein